jgi:hypothetical protein
MTMDALYRSGIFPPDVDGGRMRVLSLSARWSVMFASE